MKTDSEQPNALGKRIKGGEQRLPCSNECREIRNRSGEALRAGDQGEVAELDLERNGAAGNLGALDAIPGVASDPLELRSQPFGVAQIFIERALGADGFVGPVGLDLALIDAAAD